MDDFASAFSEVLETKEDSGTSSENRTSSENDTSSKEPVLENLTQTLKLDPIDSLESKQREARESWKVEKKKKELDEREKRLEEREKLNPFDPKSDNPIKDLKKVHGWTHDDVVSKALAALEDEGMTETEAKAEVKNMTQEEIIAKVKAELKREQEEEGAKSQSEKAVKDFKESITKFSKENAETYPLIDALGVQESVYKAIEQDFLKKSEEFGEDYAIKNMMKMEDAAKKVNESLASEIKTALKSESMRKFLAQALKDEAGAGNKSNQSQEDSQLKDEFATLTNDFMRQVTDPKDQRVMTKEEALADAFKYL